MEDINLNLKPGNVTRYRKTPLVAGVIIFGLLLFYLITQLSHRTQQAKNEARQQEAAVSAPMPEGTRAPYWFEDEKYSRPETPPALPEKLPEAEAAPVQATSGVLARAARAEAKPGKALSDPLPMAAPMRQDNNGQQDAIHAPARVAVSYGSAAQAPAHPAVAAPVLPSTPVSSPVQESSREAFLRQPVEEAVYLGHRKTAPLSPVELKAGSVIPAALITGLNSDLPGSVIGQVRENIYDTVSGNHLLIPQGARLIGNYDARVHFGQSRALVVWSRLIFPDGQSITLERMQGADGGGYSGFSDEVNHHYGRIYGNALLMSVLGSGYDLLSPDNSNTTDTRVTDTVAAAVGQQLAQVSGEMIRKNLNIQPTIVIKAGYKFNVMVMKDVVLDALE